jgi:hypothetical protein
VDAGRHPSRKRPFCGLFSEFPACV